MKKTKLIILFLSIATTLLLFFFKENRNASIAKKLKTISQDEYQCLDYFFRSELNCLGYSLFGNKPIAVMGYHEPLTEINSVDKMLNRIFCTFHPENLKMYRGWELWKKHHHLFPMKNYAIIKSKNFFDNNYAAILFINKKEFKKTVQNNIRDFKEILGNEVTPESLLNEVLKSKDIFGDVLKHHQGLIGTLLGFGRHNAWLFHQREELSFLSGEIRPLLGAPFSLMKQPPNSLFQKELDALNQTLQPFDDREVLDLNPLFLSLPDFVADPNTAETKRLKADYEQQYRQIIHHYQKGNFLETTLQKMTSEN